MRMIAKKNILEIKVRKNKCINDLNLNNCDLSPWRRVA